MPIYLVSYSEIMILVEVNVILVEVNVGSNRLSA
jgi:hypothetical protein